VHPSYPNVVKNDSQAALSYRIILALYDDLDLVLLEQLRIILGSLLNAATRVMHQAGPRFSFCQRHCGCGRLSSLASGASALPPRRASSSAVAARIPRVPAVMRQALPDMSIARPLTLQLLTGSPD
jgi:hypothetical protein